MWGYFDIVVKVTPQFKMLYYMKCTSIYITPQFKGLYYMKCISIYKYNLNLFCVFFQVDMPRTYKRALGSRKYKDYSQEKLQQAVEAVRNGASVRQASLEFGPSRATITKILNGGKSGKVGKPYVLSDEEQEKLAQCLSVAGDWGFPLTTYDVRLVVKGFLDRSGRTITTFKNNLPGRDFVLGFLARHKQILSNKMCQNIKRSRAMVDDKILNEYFDELGKTLNGVKPEHIINYDETNITDDPGRKKVIVRRGSRHPERVIDSTKSSTSVMFSCAADGTLLPPYIVYKAEHLYSTWVENGLKGAVYNRSKSGWFNLDIFEDWFRTIAIPYFRKVDPSVTKAIIGDNLSSHISPWIIEQCQEMNIKFILLPPNSTGLTQPLDVSFFRPLKYHWRKTLEDWKNKNRGTIPKDKFPRLLKKCLDGIGEENIAKNILSGFSGAGIVPLDRNQVLKRLPQKASTPCQSDSSVEWVNTFKTYMKECRMQETQPLRKPSRKKLNVPAGRGVDAQAIQEIVDQPIQPPAVSKKQQKRKRTNGSSDTSDDSLLTLRDSDSDLILSSTSDDDFDDVIQNKTASPVEDFKKTEVKMDEIPDEEEAFVIVELVFDKDTKKESKKLFYAKVQEKNIINDTISLKFLRKSGKSVGNVYVFPLVEDVMEVKRDKIVQLVKPLNVVRGRFTFAFDVK